MDSITIKPNKIIRTELMAHANTSIFEHKDVHSVKKYKIQSGTRKYYPKFPQSLNKTMAQLKFNQNENYFKYKGEKCIHISNKESIIICLTTIKKY